MTSFLLTNYAFYIFTHVFLKHCARQSCQEYCCTLHFTLWFIFELKYYYTV